MEVINLDIITKNGELDAADTIDDNLTKEDVIRDLQIMFGNGIESFDKVNYRQNYNRWPPLSRDRFQCPFGLKSRVIAGIIYDDSFFIKEVAETASRRFFQTLTFLKNFTLYGEKIPVKLFINTTTDSKGLVPFIREKDIFFLKTTPCIFKAGGESRLFDAVNEMIDTLVFASRKYRNVRAMVAQNKVRDNELLNDGTLQASSTSSKKTADLNIDSEIEINPKSCSISVSSHLAKHHLGCEKNTECDIFRDLLVSLNTNWREEMKNSVEYSDKILELWKHASELYDFKNENVEFIMFDKDVDEKKLKESQIERGMNDKVMSLEVTNVDLIMMFVITAGIDSTSYLSDKNILLERIMKIQAAHQRCDDILCVNKMTEKVISLHHFKPVWRFYFLGVKPDLWRSVCV